MFGRSLASTQGIDNRFGADEAVGVRRAAQIITQHLVHGVSQTVRVDVVFRSVDSDSVGVEAGERFTQQVTDGFVVSLDLVEDAKLGNGFFFEIADDGDASAVPGEDQRRFPGEVVGADEQVEGGVAHAGGLAHEGEP